MSGRKPNAYENRRSGFKFQGLTPEELRRRREETSVEIRKAKREDSLNKRRNIVEASLAKATDLPASSIDTDVHVEEGVSTLELSQKLPNMCQGIYSGSLETILLYAQEFRKVLSKERNPPIQDVVNCGVVPRFVELLSGSTLSSEGAGEQARQAVERIQFESAWVLTNIASGNSEQTAIVVKNEAVPIFIKLLGHHSEDIREQCIWALGNIAGDSPQCRDYVLHCNIMMPLLSIIHDELASNSPRLSMIRNAAWTLSNLCRGKPSPAWNQVVVALSTINALLQSNDDEILADSCWTLSYMSDGPSDCITDVISAGVVPRVVALLSHRNSMVQTPALRAIGNIVTGNDEQTQCVINCGALPSLRSLLSSPKSSIQKEACWAISNITAGNPEQIQAVLEANIVSLLVNLLAHADFKTKKEACWAICNATSAHETHPHQVKYLVNQGCIRPLCDLLTCQDTKIIQVAIDGIDNILEVGEHESYLNDDGVNPYALIVEEAQGMEKIYELQNHDNTKIYLKAKSIIDKYFNEDDEEIGDELADANEGSFSFSRSASHVPQGGFSFPS